MGILLLKVARTRRYGVHCPAQATVNLPPLVPSRNGIDLLLVQLSGLQFDGKVRQRTEKGPTAVHLLFAQMVLQFELRRSRRDVLGKHRSISAFVRALGLLVQYYAFRALKFRIPRWISMMITLLQLSQMIIGFWINVIAWVYKANGVVCQVTNKNLNVSLMMYGTYFLLFAHFFLGSYIFKSSSRGKPSNEPIAKKTD